MKITRRILSLALAACLLVTCCVAGLVMPASAAAVDLLNGIGSFEMSDIAELDSTALKYFNKAYSGGTTGSLVADPLDADHGNVLALEPNHSMYALYKKLYNVDTSAWNKELEAGKSYTLTFDAYGDAIGLYFQKRYTVTSENAEKSQGKAGWFSCGTDDGWKTYTFTFYAADDIATSYHADWWSWGQSWQKTTGAGEYGGRTGTTYLDNIRLVETQATDIAIDHVGLPVGEEVQLTATATPERSDAGTLTWSVTGNATIDTATGKLTVGGEGDITVTVSNGTLSDTWTTRVYNDPTRVDLSLEEFYDNVTAANSVVYTDETDGRKYITVNTNGAQNWAAVRSAYFGKKEKGEWVGFSFSARTNDGTGNVAAAIQTQGGITEGYLQPEFTISATRGGGGWVNYTFYFRIRYADNNPYVNFSVKTDSTTAKTGYDISNVFIFSPTEGEMNLAGASGDMENGAPYSIANMSNAYITEDPKDANNKVWYVPSGSTTYIYAATQTYYTGEDDVRQADQLKPNTMYKVTYRQLGTTQLAVGDSKYATKLLEQGSPTSNSTEWKWITAYYLVGGSGDDANSLFLRSYGTYIDDFQIYEVGNATALAPTVENTTMEVGTTQSIVVNTVPKHAYPGTVTLASGDTTVATVSGTTLTAATKKDGTVTITATSDLVDEAEQPIAGTVDVKVSFPLEQYTDGAMETEETSVYFSDSNWAIAEGVGVNGSKGLKLWGTDPHYLWSQNYKVKANTTYRISVDIRTDLTGTPDLELNWVTGNWDDAGTFKTSGVGYKRAYSTWTTYYFYIVTDPGPSSNNSYNFYLQARNCTPTEETPFYVDNFSMVMLEDGIDTDGALFPAGTFDYGNDMRFVNSLGYWTTDPADSNNGVIAVDADHKWSGSKDFLGDIPWTTAYGIYKISFDTKVSSDWSGTVDLYFANDNNGSHMRNYSKTGATFEATTEWQTNEFYVVMNEDTTFKSNVFYFNMQTYTSGTMYFDNLKFERITNDDSAIFVFGASVSPGFYVGGTGSRVSYAEDVAGDTLIRVKLYEYNNNALKPGGLVYHYLDADGNHKKINVLNHKVEGYTAETFGKNNGQDYEFIKPEGSGYLQVTMASCTATDNVLIGTVGTSLRATAEPDTYDGIRFLTRLSFDKSGTVEFVPGETGEELTFKVTKGGVTYHVVEMGSYLARATGEETLGETATGTLDGTNYKWHGLAYKKGDATYGTMKILDYTSRGIDFAVVMKTTYEDRAYTARGYMILDADGDINTTDDQQYVWSDVQMTDSMASARARM